MEGGGDGGDGGDDGDCGDVESSIKFVSSFDFLETILDSSVIDAYLDVDLGAYLGADLGSDLGAYLGLDLNAIGSSSLSYVKEIDATSIFSFVCRFNLLSSS
jgi:hypothetical protein